MEDAQRRAVHAPVNRLHAYGAAYQSPLCELPRGAEIQEQVLRLPVVPLQYPQERAGHQLPAMPHNTVMASLRHGAETPGDPVSSAGKTCRSRLPGMSRQRRTKAIHGNPH